MKTILVVSYHFPPEEGSCSEKNTRIVQLLLDAGFKVIVITKSGLDNNYNSNPNLKILRTNKTGILHPNRAYNTCNSSKGAGNNKNSNIKKYLSRAIIPDATIDWLFEVRKTIKQYREEIEKCDVILSISSPYSAHLISKYISKKFNKPYILCYGDPWIYEAKRKRGWLRYRAEFALEQSLISESAGVLLITEWNKQKYQQLYSIEESKISTYHIGYDEKDILPSESNNNKTFSVVYGGSLDPVHRNPQPFILALKDIENIHVTIYNNDSSDLYKMISQYKVEDKVICKPLIKSSEFIKEMYKNDALILFGNKTPFQVPGKVFTYISTGKTIIYLKNNDYENDGTQTVLQEYGNQITVKNDSEQIKSSILYFMNNKKSFESNSNREKFEFHKTMAPIIDMINKVLDKSQDNIGYNNI